MYKIAFIMAFVFALVMKSVFPTVNRNPPPASDQIPSATPTPTPLAEGPEGIGGHILLERQRKEGRFEVERDRGEHDRPDREPRERAPREREQ